MLTHGYPAHTISCAWLGCLDDALKQVGIRTWFCRRVLNSWLSRRDLLFSSVSHYGSKASLWKYLYSSEGDAVHTL